jgi:hypothetical protein
MAKKRAKQKGMGFAIFMVIYAVVALVGIGMGLKWFWGFMEAYEASRPHIPVERLMATISRETIIADCDDILEQVDFNIQSREECRELLMEAMAEEITCARKASACTETEQTYVIRSGKRVIGSFIIEAGQADQFGFTPWSLTSQSFDLSYLMGTETLSALVPEGFSVYVNGVLLDDSYIVDREERKFAVLEEFYRSYDIPMLVLCTYEAGPFLGADYEMEIYDKEGNPFVMDENFDENDLIRLKDQKVVSELEEYLEEFIEVYVLFAGCANDNRDANYKKVIKYVVPGSSLAQRMYAAVEGLEFAQSRGDEVADIQIHHYVELEPGIYMCDVTYYVNTTGYEGVVQTTNNAKLILVRSDDGLLVESMIGY